MIYTRQDMEDDLKAAARALHLAYQRAKYARQRWYSGISNEFIFENDVEFFNMMNRIDELVSDMENTNNAKLNTVLAVSDLKLPRDLGG